MNPNQRKYDEHFRLRAVEMVEANGNRIRHVAGQLGLPRPTLARWVYMMRKSKTPLLPPSPPPRLDPQALAAENAELRRKLADAQLRLEILKKAMAICSSDPLLPKDSK